MKTFNIFGDIIGEEPERWYASEVSPKQIVDFLKEANGEPVEFNINSYGGSVTGGLAICNAIKNYSGPTTCNVLGLAASMAATIACAGKELKMGAGSFLMIHNPWTYTSGDAEELRKDADMLDKMRESIIGFYQTKNTKSAEELRELMDAETWISRDEAEDYGFNVFDYAGELKAAASLTRRAYAKAPEAAKALIIFKDRKPEEPVQAENAAQPEEPVAPVAPVAQTEDAEHAEHTPEPVAQVAQAEDAKHAEHPAHADNWEARFKGLSTKYNELKAKSAADLADAEAKHKAALDAANDTIAQLKTQNEQSQKDLADANAKVSELSAQIKEKAKALQKATDDLAATRDSLTKAEDKARQLEDTRDMLTAGVLTPPEASTYADKMKAAKTPEERENLRAQKRAGKIK